TGGFGYVLLEWVMPKYNGHSLAEVWRGTEDNLSDAVLVGTTPGQVYSDPVDPGWKGFYWIRFVNSAGVSGPYNSPDGTPAETQMDVQAVIDQIHDEAAKSPIVEELKKEISDSAKAVNEHIEKISEDGGKAFQAMWGQKASAAGITAGIGIVAGKDGAGDPVSQVAIAATQLFVFDPNNPGNTAYPFAVSGGKVVIQKAVIYDAVVQTLAAQRIVADEVKVGATLTAPYIRSGTISNGNFTVDSN
ncbi:TPA: phage tail tip fiber protein, partial [Salmonella enterica subsp. enterica serovar Muenchen]